jgi:hypothetical protein
MVLYTEQSSHSDDLKTGLVPRSDSEGLRAVRVILLDVTTNANQEAGASQVGASGSFRAGSAGSMIRIYIQVPTYNRR